MSRPVDDVCLMREQVNIRCENDTWSSVYMLVTGTVRTRKAKLSSSHFFGMSRRHQKIIGNDLGRPETTELISCGLPGRLPLTSLQQV